MTKGTGIFILGAVVGIIGSALANSPLDPFHDWIVSKECQQHYAKELHITPAEFVSQLEQMKK